MTEPTPAAQGSAAETALRPAQLRESDNALMRGLLLARSAAATAPSFGRGFWRYYGKERLSSLSRFLREDYRPHPALYLAVALALFGGVTFAQSHSLATAVVVNGEYAGAVANRGVFENARAFVQASASEALGYDYDFANESLRTHPTIAANSAILSQDALVDKICDANSIVSYSYVLKVDGQTVATGESEDAIKDALMAKLSQYRTEDTISVEFSAPITISREIVGSGERASLADVEEAVNATSQEEVVYTIQAGDTWSEIAARYEMSSDELLALNPGFDMDKIWEGQELTVSAAVPLLSVKTVDRVQYQDSVPFETEYVDDSSMYQGESRVLTQGVNGVADVEATVTYVDGQETGRDIISSTVVTEPVTQVVATGTKERPKTMASGSFSWPTSGRITSTFGGRASPGGIGSTNHKGIAIAGSRGRAINAADGGTVSYAGWMGGYGYLVIIDHGNGYETYYGHNSKLLVSAGDKVYKGQQIAKMGSTGNSTGNHCHFEVRLYGTPRNPLNYLP